MKKNEVRVLSVFTALGVGGAETWLIALLRHIKEHHAQLPHRVVIDVCLTGGFKATLDEEAQSLGANLYYMPYTRKTILAFIVRFRRLLRVRQYDAIHHHQDYTAGLHFLCGIGLLPPVRIVHVHNPLLHIDDYSSSWLRRATIQAGRFLIARLATHLMGTSKQLLAEYKFNTKHFEHILQGAGHCGFDVARFRNDHTDRNNIRRELQWGKDDKIILFVGRLTGRQKSPLFALEVAKASVEQDPAVRFIMVGGGDKEKVKFQNLVEGWGLQNKIQLLGVRPDVDRLMKGADILLFPSLAEGLGMVAVEAQAAGLPVLASDGVPRECVVIPGMVSFQSLNADASIWASDILRILKSGSVNYKHCNLAVEKSVFSIENSAMQLLRLYSRA